MALFSIPPHSRFVLALFLCDILFSVLLLPSLSLPYLPPLSPLFLSSLSPLYFRPLWLSPLLVSAPHLLHTDMRLPRHLHTRSDISLRLLIDSLTCSCSLVGPLGAFSLVVRNCSPTGLPCHSLGLTQCKRYSDDIPIDRMALCILYYTAAFSISALLTQCLLCFVGAEQAQAPPDRL